MLDRRRVIFAIVGNGLLLLLVGTVPGCAGTPALRPGSSAPADTSLFAAVVRSIYSGPEPFLSVDPRPLSATPDAIQIAGYLADVPSRLLEERRAALRRLGVPEVNMSETPLCAGVLVPPPVDRSACPARPQMHAIVGLPRAGGAYWAGSDVDEREEGSKQGHWAVRVIEQTRSPYGSGTTIRDYVLRQSAGRWELVKKESLLWLH